MNCWHMVEINSYIPGDTPLPDVRLGVNNMLPDHMGWKHTGVAFTALVAELEMGCTHTFPPLEDTGETQRSC